MQVLSRSANTKRLVDLNTRRASFLSVNADLYARRLSVVLPIEMQLRYLTVIAPRDPGECVKNQFVLIVEVALALGCQVELH